ncbi:MAG: hypothetical protein JSW11_09945 [Candidatus Heimdallarchaeota archaeon]|nr:MAG: hypothetical protein JSW11_09945 [Candidatus Heimdallarchaeota archaeon]
MSSTTSSPLSPELIGIWSVRSRSRFEKRIQLFFLSSTVFSLLIILIEIVQQISLVPIAAFLISGSIILTLEFYTSKHPEITVPISQGVIIIAASYLHFYNLSQQIGFLDKPNFPLFPNLFGIILGIIILVRLITGLELIKLKRWHQNARTPLSHYQEEALTIFQTNLLLTSSSMKQEFLEELPRVKLKRLISYIFFSISILFLFLIPLWLNIFLNVIIYPYILLIPGIFVTLFLVLYFSSKTQT